jgi:hypothetical protein
MLELRNSVHWLVGCESSLHHTFSCPPEEVIGRCKPGAGPENERALNKLIFGFCVLLLDAAACLAAALGGMGVLAAPFELACARC